MEVEDSLTTSSNQPPDFSALPADVLRLLLGLLGLKDLLNATSTCSSWHRVLQYEWRGRCQSRWKHWATPPPAEGAECRVWRDTYVRRHQVDRAILQILSADTFREVNKTVLYRIILNYGKDALDALAAAARSNTMSGLYVGLAHRAHTVLLLLQANLTATQVKETLAAERAAIQAASTAVSTPAVGASAAAAAGSAGDEPTTAGPAASPDAEPQSTAAAAALSATHSPGAMQPQQHSHSLPAGGVATPVPEQDGPRDYVLEVALHLNQALHPLTDTAAVKTIIDQLGQELHRRMQVAGAAPGSQQALELLNGLLYGPPPQPTVTPSLDWVFFNASTTSELLAAVAAYKQHNQQGGPNTTTSARSSSSTATTGQHGAAASAWSDVWPPDPMLCGPDLSGFEVPTDGRSGLAFKEEPDVFGQLSSSCLDSTLAARTGLPIILAILHRAIGRWGGLDIELVNTPGRVINHVTLNDPAGNFSSSSRDRTRDGGSRSQFFVDVFKGQKLLEDREFNRWLASSTSLHPHWTSSNDDASRQRQLPLMTAADVCKRMLANLLALYDTSRLDQVSAPIDGVSVSTRPQPPLLAPTIVSWGKRFIPHDSRIRSGYVVGDEEANRGLGQLLDPMFAGVQASTNLQPPSQRTAFTVGDHVKVLKPGRPTRTGFVSSWVARSGGNVRKAFSVITHVDDVACEVWANAEDMRLVTPAPAAASSSAGSAAPPVSHPLVDVSGPPYGQAVHQAHHLLQDCWFDDDFGQHLAPLMRGLGQTPAAEEDMPCGRLAVDLRRCRLGLGHFFEALAYCRPLRKWCLVPRGAD